MGIDYGRCYHQGVRVPDLDAAMAELGPALGVEWCTPQEREQTVWLPGTGTTTLPLRFTYSAGEAQHIELLEGPPGSIWDGREHPGIHHVGLWSDDVRGETEHLLAAGWTLQLAQQAPEDGYGVFTYVQPPSGLLVELVWSAVEPMFSRWFAGGELG
ncbi:VOC family protein [Desertimonas flava]|jgi:catechol 2,3-dioxygenase-like lactoylglutathione lyase family enzyme|uniref:VOC family protein n=1 Tax=Desertimonas flava TaxID=2064846 RepID=UPI000E343CEE|nr:VOC family protein [Desertimonas flava]